MAVHPPLTWGQVKKWAEDNKVPDNAVVVSQEFRPVRDLGSGDDYDAERPYFRMQTVWG